MTNHRGSSAEAARQTLSTHRDLTHRVRLAQRSTWFPLVLLGLVVLAAAPFYRMGRHTVTCDPALGARGGIQIIHRGTCVQVVSWPAGVYWMVAFVLAYTAIAAVYLHRARSRGVDVRILPYAGAGIGAGVVFGIVAAWSHQLDLAGRFPSGPVAVGMVPLVSIGLTLLVLARLERNPALLVFTVGYSIVALMACGIGPRSLGPDIGADLGPMWGFLPGLAVAGGALLLGGIGFALAERRGL
ncbi:hypothetical protein ACPESR_10090 [Nocardia testacea]|uniref:hypothetical protein n=1 Tax=Nocardia testacea TaxID=248551 RepID=UPI003C2DC46C